MLAAFLKFDGKNYESGNNWKIRQTHHHISNLIKFLAISLGFLVKNLVGTITINEFIENGLM